MGSSLSANAADELSGKELFATNCAACHMPDQMLVGPSLVEISSLYKDKPDEFIAWCIAPKVKRKNVIEMPSMAHVGKENLLQIREYILDSSKGLVKKKVDTADKYAVTTTGPKIQRIFMPEAGSADIAVRLGNGYSLCWDAGVCRLRYVWLGDFNTSGIFAGNGNSLAYIKGKILFTEKASPLLDMKVDSKVKFLGYTLKNGLPTFNYTVDGKVMSERFEPMEDGFKRIFTIDGSTTGLELRDIEYEGVETTRSTASTLEVFTKFTQ